MQCQNCGTKWNTQSRYCPTCGQLYTDNMIKKHQKGYLVLSGILQGLFIFLWLGFGADEEGLLDLAIMTAVIWLWYACGYCVQSLAWRKGYNISFGWGYWFGIFAILYWGFAPMEPTMQKSIIAQAIRQAQRPVYVQDPTQPMPVEAQNPVQTTLIEAQLCASCGAKLKPGASFCSQCGSIIK